jgi:hypothetical protein
VNTCVLEGWTVCAPEGYAVSEKDRQHNGKIKRTNNDLQDIAQKAKYREPRTPLKTGVIPCAPEG